MKHFIIILIAISLIGCNSPDNSKNEISLENIENHIIALSSDDFLGRQPFTEGETKTINYIKSEFEKLGVQPGNKGSYFQEVPMVEIEATNVGSLEILSSKGTASLEFMTDFVALTRRVTEQIDVKDSEIVFAGYGIVAPEYNWNDYENLDVKGKTVVVLVNDPGFGGTDESFFKANTMTYYGRWTYKYEEAARQGAEGVIIVHDTAPAAYPWGVVESGWTGANLYLKSEDNNMGRCAFEGWITKEQAQDLFNNAGKPEFDFTAAAKSSEFEAFSLDQKLSLSFSNNLKSSVSNNVVGVIPGTDLVDEFIIYSGHWDHLGVGLKVKGDSIYNGAIDNASGIAAMIDIARVFKEGAGNRRSIMMLAVTAEEQGLLGSEYYSVNPIEPANKTVANINMDALGVAGEMKDLTIVGFGQSELDDYAKEIAETQGRYTMANPSPEKGYFFRSDHFNFAKIGIPALYAAGTYEHMSKGVEFAKELTDGYEANDYHQPSDEYRPEDHDLAGMAQDADLFYQIGLKLANENTFPNWKVGSEFKAIRDASMSR